MPELEWVTGRAPQPTKFRIRPYLGAQHVDPREVRSHVRARLSRWRQLRLSERELRRALAYEVLVMLRAGYPWRRLRAAWVGHSSDHEYGPTVAALFAHMGRPPGV